MSWWLHLIIVGYAELHLDQDVESTTTVEELLESTTIKSELKAKLSSMLAKSKGRKALTQCV